MNLTEFEKLYPHATTILKEMCKRIGVDYNTVDFFNKEKPYFWQYSWGEKESVAFIGWLTDYLYNNLSARKELMSIRSKNKKFCKNAAYWFELQYGWKIKYEKNDSKPGFYKEVKEDNLKPDVAL